MPLIHHIPLLSILLLLAAAVLAALISAPRAALYLVLGIMALVLLGSLLLSAFLLPDNGVFTYNLGHFAAPFVNQLRAGSWEALFATLFSLVMPLALAGGWSDAVNDIPRGKRHLYLSLLCLLQASMLALIYSNDLFTAYVFIEINTIAACAIVMVKEHGHTLPATVRYLVMSLLGSGLILLAIAIIYATTGQLLLEAIRAQLLAAAAAAYPYALTVALALISVGLMIKAAIFPFHSWLADAHSSATTSASAILSALVLKGYFLLLLKLYYRLFGGDFCLESGIRPLLLWLGVASMIIASLAALGQYEIKRLLAFSSISQVGYLFLGLGLGSESALAAACYQVWAHALAKAMLFLLAGRILRNSGIHDLRRYQGLGKMLPLTMALFSLGALSLIGIPPLPGFRSKWALALAAVEAGSLPALLALSLSTLLTALYYLPVIIRAYLPGKGARLSAAKRGGDLAAAGILGLLLLCLACGLPPLLPLLTRSLITLP